MACLYDLLMMVIIIIDNISKLYGFVLFVDVRAHIHMTHTSFASIMVLFSQWKEREKKTANCL